MTRSEGPGPGGSGPGGSGPAGSAAAGSGGGGFEATVPRTPPPPEPLPPSLLADRAALRELAQGFVTATRERKDALQRSYTIEDLRRLARRRLPRSVFGYLDGGADEEHTLRANVEAFSRYTLRPDAFVDVSHVDPGVTVLGRRIAAPLVLAPVGLTRLFHQDGEEGAARAARRHGLPYTLSTASTATIEDVAAAAGDCWFQLYVWRDRQVAADLIARAQAAGYHALCLTVDVPVLGRRLRDARTGLTIPPRLGPNNLLDVALHPAWWKGLLTGRPIRFVNVPQEGGAMGTLARYAQYQFDPGVTWADLDWLVKRWSGPVVVKGVLDAAVARRAVDAGARGIVVSNHGGRQLDRAAASLDVLEEICQVVGDDADVLFDGGVRSGGDIAIALALGARACMVGRAYAYGLGARGEAGVERALTLLLDELRRTMALLGCPTVGDLGPRHLIRAT